MVQDGNLGKLAGVGLNQNLLGSAKRPPGDQIPPIPRVERPTRVQVQHMVNDGRIRMHLSFSPSETAPSKTACILNLFWPPLRCSPDCRRRRHHRRPAPEKPLTQR